jgi:hypothetical protein
MDFYQHLAFLGSRFGYLFKLENLRRPVFGVYNRFHEIPPDLL